MSDSTLPPLPNTNGVVRSKNEKKAENKRMEITIHVCDETKNLKKDFTCPKTLLLNEMKYFQDYLSSDTQTWEDIDISVHCDVKIFDWLIRYVKRDKSSVNHGPCLDVKTAVSILISSEFLKMDRLVEECIEYCCGNLSEIIASPCNMNCINDALVHRIAASFTLHDLEQVIDKKDKFKSKMFCKKIEELFDPKYSSKYSPNNASSLYKCLHCGRLLLSEMEKRIECTVARTIIDHSGNLEYVHSRDHSWEITEYLLSTKQKMKNWRGVFWRLWSIINYMECCVCKKIFPLCQYNNCRYHQGKPTTKVNLETGVESLVYPCCGSDAMLFEPIACTNGCRYQDHEVAFAQGQDLNNKVHNSADVFNELLTVLEIVCEEKTTNTNSSFYNLESMIKVESSRLNKYVSIVSKEEKRDRKRPLSQKSFPSNVRKSIHPVNKSRSKRTDSIEEDDLEIDEPGIVRIVIQHKESPSWNKNHSKTWNTALPTRLNQDMQRENDVNRMNDMLQELAITRNTCTQGQGHDKIDPDGGGIYHRIETKLKLTLAQNTSVKTTSSATSTQTKISKNR